MGVPPQDGAEEGAAGGQDDFVGVDLVIVACEGHVEKVFIISQFSKSPADVRLKVVPLEAELFGAHCRGLKLTFWRLIFLVSSENQDRDLVSLGFSTKWRAKARLDPATRSWVPSRVAAAGSLARRGGGRAALEWREQQLASVAAPPPGAGQGCGDLIICCQ